MEQPKIEPKIPPEAEKKEELIGEHFQAEKPVAEGKVAVVPFRGQNFLFIPNAVWKNIGEARVRELAMKFYSEEKLQKFGWSSAECRNSLMLEMPPFENETMDAFIAEVQKEAGTSAETYWAYRE